MSISKTHGNSEQFDSYELQNPKVSDRSLSLILQLLSTSLPIKPVFKSRKIHCYRLYSHEGCLTQKYSQEIILRCIQLSLSDIEFSHSFVYKPGAYVSYNDYTSKH